MNFVLFFAFFQVAFPAWDGILRCNLDGFKIESVEIFGDDDGHIAKAIENRLRFRGAKVDPGGYKIVGLVLKRDTGGRPVDVILVTLGKHQLFGRGYGDGSPMGNISMVRMVELDFCLAAARLDVLPNSPPKKE